MDVKRGGGGEIELKVWKVLGIQAMSDWLGQMMECSYRSPESGDFFSCELLLSPCYTGGIEGYRLPWRWSPTLNL